MHKARKLVLNGLYYSGLSTCLSPFMRGFGSILMLHRTSATRPATFCPNAHLDVSPVFLDRLFGRLKQDGFQFVSMDDIADEINNRANGTEAGNQSKADGKRPKKIKGKLAVTLDDGYRDNLENIVPIFRKHDIPYTFFIAPGLVDGRATIWWEDLERLIASVDKIYLPLDKGPLGFDCRNLAEKQSTFADMVEILTTSVDEHQQRNLMQELEWLHKFDAEGHRAKSIMTWHEIQELNKDPLCTIGAHTIHHYAVARLDEEEALYEMRESGNIIKSELGEFPRHFAYPYGYPAAAGPRDFKLANKAGFDSAVTTRHGVLYDEHKDHAMALPRISLNGLFQSVHETRVLLSGAPTRLQNRGKKLSID